MRYEPTDLVEVWAWGRLVGAVALDSLETGFYAFGYDPDWIRSGSELSPLLMPGSTEPFVFTDLDPRTFHRLPPLVADALPDRFGNALVNAWMVDQGVPAHAITPLDRLAYVAARGMGALEFYPPAGVVAEATAIQLADLVTAARSTLAGDMREAPEDALRDLIQVGTSAGGARAKAVIAFDPKTGRIRSGQVGAPPGFEEWLIKLDGVDTDPSREHDPFTAGSGYGRLEYAYYLMATAAGVEMSQCQLLPEGPRTHFLTRRFDRGPDGQRIHMQSLCGIAALDFNLAGAHSYGQYMDTIGKLGMGPDAREQAFRRIAFNVAAVNRDDHTKNLAFLLPEGGDWQLAPAYDVTHSHNPAGQWTARHQMSVNGKRLGITTEDLVEFADRFGVPGYRNALAEVLAAVEQWPDFAEDAGVEGDRIERVAADLHDARPG
jgi:serine/threonine-protein kinase HipA